MNTRTFLLAAGLPMLALGAVQMASSHCEIPCGIYEDEMRFDMIDEDLMTIEKSMTEIAKLSGEGEKNYNQIVRWVMNKEEHAGKLRDILTVYFLDQRVKPVDDKASEAYKTYQTQLETIHAMMIETMKCKQTIDVEHVKKLRELSKQLYVAYFGKDHVRHMPVDTTAPAK